jgi:hypothetical protein
VVVDSEVDALDTVGVDVGVEDVIIETIELGVDDDT